MSAGPISQWRDAHRPHLVSTPDNQRVCAPNIDTGKAYCGRRGERTGTWNQVTCSDCWSARRADEEAD